MPLGGQEEEQTSWELEKRGRWCYSCRLTCPIHSLWPYLEDMQVGHNPFAKTPAPALARLRSFLRELGVANAGKYRTHDWRRGHARDMQIEWLG